ncbi:MAG: pilus assembly protein [Anaerolineae bacterium]|nr:pilus assembly protein [Anaerolineae bacterium]
MVNLKLKKRMQHGQSLAEFALSLTLLILLLSGLIDLGRAYFVYTQLEDAVGEGALYLAINPRCRTSGGGTGCSDPNNAMYRIRNSGGGLVNWSDESLATVNVIYIDTTDPVEHDSSVDLYGHPDGYEMQDTVVVTITYQFRLLSPFIPGMAGGPSLPLTVRATQSIIEK